jgi:BON domain
MKRSVWTRASMLSACLVFAGLAGVSVCAEDASPQMDLAKKVGRDLAALPNYDVFDLLTYEVSDTGVVTLGGYVLHTSLKAEAERAVRKIPGVKDVQNKIEELLPASNADENVAGAKRRAGS